MAHANNKIGGIRDQNINYPSRGRLFHGRGCGRGCTMAGTQPTCHLCGKHGYFVMDC